MRSIDGLRLNGLGFGFIYGRLSIHAVAGAVEFRKCAARGYVQSTGLSLYSNFFGIICHQYCLNLRNFPQTPNRGSRSRRGRCPGEKILSAAAWEPLENSRLRSISPNSEHSAYETVHAPPATVFLHDLQFQIPTE